MSGSPQRYEGAVRRALDELNPNLTILYVRSFAGELSLNFTRDLLLSRLTLLYGLLSLLLCSVGLYGVLFYSVVRRTNEIGIRMALGADRASVVKLILRGAVRLGAIGLLLGCPLALVAGYLLRNQLFGVGPADPLVLLLASCVLVATSFVGAYVSARRAARINPMQALRNE